MFSFRGGKTWGQRRPDLAKKKSELIKQQNEFKVNP
jgi:hypothetical protein